MNLDYIYTFSTKKNGPNSNKVGKGHNLPLMRTVVCMCACMHIPKKQLCHCLRAFHDTHEGIIEANISSAVGEMKYISLEHFT